MQTLVVPALQIVPLRGKFPIGLLVLAGQEQRLSQLELFLRNRIRAQLYVDFLLFFRQLCFGIRVDFVFHFRQL